MTADPNAAGASVRLGHVALAAARPDRLASFYRDLIGLQLVRRAGNEFAGRAVLFSGRPAEEDHELVLLGNPHAVHVAFRVASPAALVAFYRRAIAAAVPMPIPPQDFGMAHSVFVTDPEGHHCEVYWPTGRPPEDAPRPLDLGARDRRRCAVARDAWIAATPPPLHERSSMHTKPSLDLTDAKALAAAAEAYAETNGLQVSIAVVDVQHLVRMDGARYTSAEGAFEKARTAAEGGHPTTFFEEPLNAGRYSILKMPHIYPVEGGLPVIVDGRCAGAIGVAGVLPHLDAEIANAGLQALPASALA